MKLHLARPEGRNAITGYGDGYIAVNQQRFERSLIVLPDRLITDWSFTDLFQTEAFGVLAALDVEIVLVGTGATLRFPPAQALRPLIEKRLGFEVMDTGAACRTYNILMNEDRKVAAALVL